MKTIVLEPKVTFADLKAVLRSESAKWPRFIWVDGVSYQLDRSDIPASLTITRVTVPEATVPALELTPCYGPIKTGTVCITQHTGGDSQSESVAIDTAVTDHSWSEMFGGEIETYREVLEKFLGARYVVDWHDQPTFRDVRRQLERVYTSDGTYRLTNLPGNLAIMITKLATGGIHARLCSFPDDKYRGRHIMDILFSKDQQHVTLKAVKASGDEDPSIKPFTAFLSAPIDIDFEHQFDWAQRFKKNGELVRQILFSMVSFDRSSRTDESTYTYADLKAYLAHIPADGVPFPVQDRRTGLRWYVSNDSGDRLIISIEDIATKISVNFSIKYEIDGQPGVELFNNLSFTKVIVQANMPIMATNPAVDDWFLNFDPNLKGFLCQLIADSKEDN